MKKRYTPVITFTIAILLLGSIAYATEKRKQAKLAVRGTDALPEEETLKAELLATTGEQEKSAASEAAGSDKSADEDESDTVKENAEAVKH